MSFLTTHRRNIIDTLTINKNQIEPGDIVEFRYKSKKGNNLEIVLALNNIMKDSEKKLHAIKLENMSLPLFKRLLNEIGNPVLTTDTRKNKEITKVILDGNTETERQGFYTNTLKKFTRENIYRTYLEKNITSVKLVEYNFKNKQLGF